MDDVYNYDDNLKIGGDGAKFIYNAGKNVTVNSGEGNDTVMNYGENVVISVTGGDDIVKTYAKKVTVIGGSGNDTIINRATPDEISIEGTSKNDSLVGTVDNEKILGLGGNDTLSGGHGNDILTGGDGSDVFVYEQGDGDDVVTDYVRGQDVIKLGAGLSVDSYSVADNDAVLKIGNGSIKLQGIKDGEITVIDSKGKTATYPKVASTIPAGLNFNSDNTVVTITSDYTAKTFDAADYPNIVMISAEDHDAININGNDGTNLISDGKGNDSLSGKGGDDLLLGGEGNDTLTGGDGSDVFYYTKGTDVITDYDSKKDAIVLAEGTVSSYYTSGNDAVLKIGDGSLRIKNVGSNSFKVVDSEGNVTTYPIVDDTELLFDNKNTAQAKSVTITSNYGTDFDATKYAKLKTITATGRGDIKISGNANNNLIVGSNGTDTLYGGGGSNTLRGGKGNDVFVYDGKSNMVLDDYHEGDVIVFTDEFLQQLAETSESNEAISYNLAESADKSSNEFLDKVFGKVTVKGNDVEFVFGDWRLKIPDGAGVKITAADESGGIKTETHKVIINNYSPHDVIKKFMRTLDYSTETNATKALNAAVKSCSEFDNIQEVIDSLIKDCQDAISSGMSVGEFLKNYCGIDLKNDDTGSITGIDAGGHTKKTSNTVVFKDTSKQFIDFNEIVTNSLNLNKVEGSDYIISRYGVSTSTGNHDRIDIKFTKNGVTITVADYERLSTNERNIVNGLYNYWLEGDIKLIEESYGMGFNESDVPENKSSAGLILFSQISDNDNNDFNRVAAWSNQPFKDFIPIINVPIEVVSDGGLLVTSLFL